MTYEENNNQTNEIETSQDKKEGIVYVLINEAMEGMVKIGVTNDIDKRMSGLYRTGVPLPFECFYAKKVTDAYFIEGKLKSIFAGDIVNENREFFYTSPNIVKDALEMVEGEVIIEKYTTPTKKSGDKERRPNFLFDMANIKKGEVITYKNNREITAEVISNNEACILNGDHQDEKGTLTNLTQKLLGSKNPIAGTLYWEYEGEILSKRRQRLENDD